jgi:hypothetical protein
MAVTVSRVSVVDRMVSKEYVQTAHPYDRDLAPLGAWIETGFSSRSPWWATVTAFRRCEALEYRDPRGAGKKKSCVRPCWSLPVVA